LVLPSTRAVSTHCLQAAFRCQLFNFNNKV